MTWTDVLFIFLAMVLLVSINYLASLYVKTNDKRQGMMIIWVFLIAICYFVAYALMDLVKDFNTARIIPILLFFTALSVIKEFYKKDDK